MASKQWIPHLLLRKIDMESLIDKYEKGQFVDRAAPNRTSSIEITKSIINVRLGHGPADGLYTYQDRTMNTLKMCVTNHKNPDISNVCFWCLRQIKTDQDGILMNMGVPVSSKVKMTKDGPVTEYCMDGMIDTFECGLSHIQRYKGETLYKDSERLLKQLFNNFYPDDILRPAPDFRIRKANCGSIDDADFFNTRHFYKRTQNISLASIQVHYQVLNG